MKIKSINQYNSKCREFKSVVASIEDSVWDSVKVSVWDSVWRPVWPVV
jgi:hypothetical protein